MWSAAFLLYCVVLVDYVFVVSSERKVVKGRNDT